nr:MAG TPA: hypothetical protein [Caudoviricetes sp.]
MAVQNCKKRLSFQRKNVFFTEKEVVFLFIKKASNTWKPQKTKLYNTSVKQ